MEILINLIDVIIWPITILIIAVVFKRELKSIIGRLSGVKYKDFEANFSNEIKNIKEKAEMLQLEPKVKSNKTTKSLSQIESIEDKLNLLIPISPRVAIIAAWIEIETAIKNLANESHLKFERMPKGILNLVHELAAQNLISENTTQLYEDLFKIRNEAAHAQESWLTQSDAKLLIRLATDLLKDIYSVDAEMNYLK